MMRFVLTLMVSFIPLSASALEVIRGVFEQGGFLIARTASHNTVIADGMSIPLGRDGLFVVGFDRLHGPKATVEITNKQGDVATHTWDIAAQTYDVQNVKGVAPKHVNPDPEEMKIITSDSQKINAARDVFEDLPYITSTFSWPVSATISGVYGSRRTFNGEERSWHKGLDIAATKGTPVLAPAAGVVQLALPNSFFNGNMVILDHGHQLYTYYAHLDTLNVKHNQLVKPGDMLGTVGATGRATGPHLHWGLYWRKIALDPMLLMKKGGNDGS
jgi:murein DD-endopeptidase MepM/ murein hydrolase activator NlpD